MAIIHPIVFGLITFSSTLVAAPWQVKATNPLVKNRVQETLEFPLPESLAIPPAETERWSVWNETGTTEILSQPLDQDGDGLEDLILVQADFAPLEIKKFQIKRTTLPPTVWSGKTTFGRFVPERLDDFAWENDRVAFRMYGPALASEGGGSGVDPWLKRVPYPIINKWYDLSLKGISYHEDRGEGYDPYHVGASRGCGGLSYQIGEQIFSPAVYATQRVLANGPIRTIFELTYRTTVPSLGTVNETKRASIDLGSRLTRFDIALSMSPASSIHSPQLLIGLNTHEGRAHVTLDPEAGYASAWEAIDDSFLGTGLVMHPAFIAKAEEVKTTVIDLAHAYLQSPWRSDSPLTYFAGYGWSKAQEITTESKWNDYLRDFAENIQAPIQISLSPISL